MISKIKSFLKDENNKIILKNVSGAFLIKGGALLISLLSTPALIRYFNNNEVLGIWYTMLSALSWFLNFDLGIGNGIRNSLVTAFARNDRKEAKYVISSGIFSIFPLTVFLTIAGIILLSVLNLNSFFNISEEIVSPGAILASCVMVLISLMFGFMLSTVSSIFYALQKSAVNNFKSLCSSVLQLIFVVTCHFDTAEKSLISLSFFNLIFSNLPAIITAAIIFCTRLKDCRPNIKWVDKTHINSVLRVGGVFFLCQILYMLIANTNEFFITKLFGPEYTTTYTFYNRVTSLIYMVITLCMTPVWSVVTKAMTEGNWVWLNALYKKIKQIGFLVIAAEFGIIPFMQIIMNIWLGANSITIDYGIAVAFACFGSVFVYSSMLSTIVCGLGRMKLQAACYCGGVVFKFVFVLLLSKYTHNWSIVVWSNTILLFPYCILQQLDLNKLITKKLAA